MKTKKLFWLINTVLVILILNSSVALSNVFADENDKNDIVSEDDFVRSEIIRWKINNYTAKIITYQNYDPCAGWQGEYEGSILNNEGEVVADKIGYWKDRYGNWIKSMSLRLEYYYHTPASDLIVFLVQNWSTSSLSNRYVIYTTTPVLKKIADISGLLTAYQAGLDGSGRGHILGFYYNDKGQIYLDRLTARGQETAKSNAGQHYSVETFIITHDGAVSVNLKDYVFGKYKAGERL